MMENGWRKVPPKDCPGTPSSVWHRMTGGITALPRRLVTLVISAEHWGWGGVREGKVTDGHLFQTRVKCPCSLFGSGMLLSWRTWVQCVDWSLWKLLELNPSHGGSAGSYHLPYHGNMFWVNEKLILLRVRVTTGLLSVLQWWCVLPWIVLEYTPHYFD